MKEKKRKNLKKKTKEPKVEYLIEPVEQGTQQDTIDFIRLVLEYDKEKEQLKVRENE